MSKQGSKGIYVAALILFLGGLGWLVYSGVSQESVYFLNVSEALSSPDKLRQARLFGSVAAEGISRPEGGLGVSFTLADKDDPSKALRVEYRGAVPDTFQAGAEVIVEGGMSGTAQAFSATTLITKCPSKYEKQRTQEKAAKG